MIETLLPKLLTNIFALSPRQRVTVSDGEQGVLYRRGSIVRTLGSGAYWHWAFVEEIDVRPVALDTVTTDAVCVHTSDGVCVSVECAVSFRIADLGLVLGGVQDVAVTLGDVVQGCVARLVQAYDFGKLQRETTWVDARLRERVRTAVRGWGVDIEGVRVVSLARVRVLRVIQ